MNIRIDLNEPGIIQKVTNDDLGLFVAREWRRLIQPYTPKDTGLLEMATWLYPWAIEYVQPYAAYVYYGEMYVDPVLWTSGFLTAEGWKSRKDVKKIPSGFPLEYQNNNPYSTDHWDIKAAEAGQLNNLCITINNALQSGIY